MRLKRRLPFARVAAVVGALVLAWQIAILAVADYYALSQPETALAWKPGHTEALVQLLEREAPKATDLSQKEALAEVASYVLIGNPLNSTPFRMVALAAEESGDADRARLLMKTAAHRTRRDTLTQMWLADENLFAGDYAGAMENIDAILRVWPDMRETLLPVMSELALERESGDALIAALEENPPWRAGFLTQMPVQHEDPSELQTFYAALIAGPAPPTTEELRAFLQALVNSGDAKLAQAVWQRTLPDDAQSQPNDIQNGGFERPVSGLPFDWNLGHVRGASAELVEGENGGALRVAFYNTKVPFRHVHQVLLLDAGSYRLVGSVKANLQNERGMTWAVSCTAGSDLELGRTDRMRGSIPWSNFDMVFNVPEQAGCEAQLLRLELAARIPAEQDASGSIWFDDMRIESMPDNKEQLSGVTPE